MDIKFFFLIIIVMCIVNATSIPYMTNIGFRGGHTYDVNTIEESSSTLQRAYYYTVSFGNKQPVEHIYLICEDHHDGSFKFTTKYRFFKEQVEFQLTGYFDTSKFANPFMITDVESLNRYTEINTKIQLLMRPVTETLISRRYSVFMG
jgi:hypothetical protein